MWKSRRMKGEMEEKNLAFSDQGKEKHLKAKEGAKLTNLREAQS